MSVKQQLRLEELMVQAMLGDRFKLHVHHETRMLPIFALVLARGGSRIKPSARVDSDEPNEANGPAGDWKADGVTMAALADQLSSLPENDGRIVVDKTGLRGKFDFTLKWSPAPMTAAAPAGFDSGAGQGSSSLSLLTALREQLGLNLKSSKDHVDVLVIDSTELPSAN
jgi:uncharacterized protein (TIGR03435 family)